MKIIFIQTGGTIDKDYPKSSGGYAFEFGEPATKRILEKLNPSFDFEIITAFQKDSLDITDEDRMLLVKKIKPVRQPDGQYISEKIIITHGTDTLLETANFIAQQLESSPDENDKNKVVILTGAMRPEQFSNSDAPINVGAAIAAAQILEQGVYVVMHGIIKSYDKIQRNLETGQFY